MSVVIKNPILNSPFEEPKRHFKFTEDGITDEVVEGRRPSQYFIPIPPPKKKGGKQLSFESAWTVDRVEESKFINQVRERVAIWRKGGYVGISKTTSRLLEFWKREDRERRLFFCQIEAIETAIYLVEVASKYNDAWIENRLREENAATGSSLYRIAFKMATGSGKTVLMAMIIAWQALNKFANPQDTKFSDSFLIVAPGITIKDRLRVLLPSDPVNYYKQHDLVPPDLIGELGKARIVITNFHAFKRREKISAGKLTKDLLQQGDNNGAFTETPGEMVRRVCRELGNKKNIVVLNDEAHHCYRPKPAEEKLSGDDRKEAEKREEEARVWISGLEAVKEKLGVRMVYDVSATPFYLKGSGYKEGALFPWVVSDFSLIDAIESGIVKVPRVPVSDDAMTGDMPTYRELWFRIRDHLPKKNRNEQKGLEEPTLPKELEGAIHSLYTNYEKYFKLWHGEKDAKSRGLTPPVFIVVCNNTSVSKLVFDYISGWEKTLEDGSKRLVPGRLALFSNVDHEQWIARPNTILVDSEQLESGEAMSKDFKDIASAQIEEFKKEYRERFPGRDADKLTEEDLMREVMNTVGKAGKLGEHVRCVVSVSMLTEGWDANTVTHILGVRAFGTQLLCEQVVGRALRRMSYATDAEGFFEPEYAEVYGVPFSFIPTEPGEDKRPIQPKKVTHVRAIEDRIDCEITFPRVIGYRYKVPSEKLSATFGPSSQLALSTKDIPTEVEVSSIVGESEKHGLDKLRDCRLQEVDFRLASLVLEKYFKDVEGAKKHWLFPQLLTITRDWRRECLILKDKVFPQMLLIRELAHEAADRIYRAIVESQPGTRTLMPILRPYEPEGSTRYVEFDTAKPVYPTDLAKCHVSHVVADSTWEVKMAQVLEEMPEVVFYVKNHGLGFTIPYTIDGQEHSYIPDFIVKVDDGHGHDDLLNLIVEVSGEAKKDKAEKVATARSLWVPAVNNCGQFGRWAFLEIVDPWDAKNTIRGFLNGAKVDGVGPILRSN